MIVYKPRRHTYNFAKKYSSIQFTKNTSHRRNRLYDLVKLISVIWLYWCLTFAGKIGPIFPFIETNLNLYYITAQSNNIIIPQAYHTQKINISSRLLLNISVHKNCITVVDGYKYNKGDLYLAFRNALLRNPQICAFLIIDKNCRMEYVYDVYNALRMAKIYRVYHMVSKSGKMVL